MSRDELLAGLNELLEAERAGMLVALHTAKEMEGESKSLLMRVHHDEARWCVLLRKTILHLHGTPSIETGSFHGKAVAITDLDQRLKFLNRGQAWVIRKLEPVINAMDEPGIKAELMEMLDAHKANISLLEAHLQPPPAAG